MATATLCLGMFAFSPTTPRSSVANPQIEAADLAALGSTGSCSKYYESIRGLRHCIRTQEENEGHYAAFFDQQTVLTEV